MQNLSISRQRGATLIEVLITVLILSVGLLGLGATQMLSLKNGNNASQSYFASLAAYEIAERMRINPIGRTSYNASVVNDTLTLQDCSQAICSAADLAKMDLYEWGQLLSSNLPEGSGAIEITNDLATGIASATITVNWAGQHTGANTGTADGGAEVKTFVLVVNL
ncbi:type IV pilus modification protein PilV [Microbulbifer sp. SA54]|uniref:type IV pilus modification protein PilV n=1 Tax=Microbulbifer sp. SA54 TaxID=3401577 RepID=UPI003AAD2CD0